MDGRSGLVESYPIEAVDTTGAGDCFFAGLLYQIKKKGGIDKIVSEEFPQILSFANAAGALGDLAGLGVSLGAMGSVIGMTKDALNPMTQDAAQMGAAVGAAVAVGWDCPVCGHKNITTNFCPDCGGKKPEAKTGWDCAQCGTKNIQSRFCPNCGARKPEEKHGWICPECGTKDIMTNFCPNCGRKKDESC